MWAKFFPKNICGGVSIQWSSKKKKNHSWTKLLTRRVSKFYSQGSGNRQTSYQLNSFSGTDFSCVFKVGLTSFINKYSATFRFKSVVSLTFSNYIKVLYFGVIMVFFDGMLYQMRMSIFTIMVRYSFWQPSCRFFSIVFWALTFWTFSVISNIMLMLLWSFIFLSLLICCLI